MYTDDIEQFEVEVLSLDKSNVTSAIMRQIVREAIQKWEEWKNKK